MSSIYVPPRKGRGFELREGQVITITDLRGQQPVDFWAFNTKNILEFLSPAHTKVTIEKLVPKTGDSAYTNKRRAIITVIEDHSPGEHDMQWAACDAIRYQQIGAQGYHDSCEDNLHRTLGDWGLTLDFTPQPWNLFTNFFLNRDSTFTIKPPSTKPGDYIVLRAEMDCRVVVSACPQDINPTCGHNPTDIQVTVDD